jgi:hypothetical protein
VQRLSDGAGLTRGGDAGDYEIYAIGPAGGFVSTAGDVVEIWAGGSRLVREEVIAAEMAAQYAG